MQESRCPALANDGRDCVSSLQHSCISWTNALMVFTSRARSVSNVIRLLLLLLMLLLLLLLFTWHNASMSGTGGRKERSVTPDMISNVLSWWCGWECESISHITIAKEYTSAFSVYLQLRITSGAVHAAVPTIVMVFSSFARAIPRSLQRKKGNKKNPLE